MRRGFDAEGFTLVEVLVAMALFGVLGSVVLGFAIGSSQVGDDVRRAGRVNGDARLAVERMTRELRQASEIYAATVDAEGRVVSLQIGVDLNRTGGIEIAQGAGERLRYTWDPDTQKLVLDDGFEADQVLANRVIAADIRLRSSAWIHDLDGDGTTTWQELDASSVGNDNGQPDLVELDLVDLVSIELLVRDGGTQRRFTVQADMRNRMVTS